MAQHRNRQFTLGGKTDVGRHFRFLTALSVRTPCLRQIEPSIQKGMSPRRRIGQEHTQLTVLHLASRSTILTLYARRFYPLLVKSRLVDHTDAFPIAEPLYHKSLQRISHRFCIPLRLVQQALRRIRPLVAHRFRQPPAILPLHWRHQPLQILHRLLLYLSTSKQRGKLTVKRFEVGRPFVQFAQFHSPSRSACLLSLSPKEPSSINVRL